MKIILLLTILTFNVHANNVKDNNTTTVISDKTVEILNNSKWIYEPSTKELNLCFYLNDYDYVCTSVPKQYIIIPVTNNSAI